MASIVYTQGENHILTTYFHGGSFSGPFYIGLGKGPMPLSENSTLNDINEVVGSGYSRIPVQRDSSSLGWSVEGDMAEAPEVTWTNSNLTTNWQPVDYAFLTLSHSGITLPSVLIAAVELDNTVILEPQKKLKILFRFRQL